jgi:cathepsin A (carboxypeptidase C)
MLLEDGIRVLVYAGDADFICNYLGNSAWTLALEWKDAARFNAAKMRPWILDGSEVHAGDYRTYGNFTFLRNFEAGHMVPYDQPAASLDFFNRWIYRRNL